MSTREMAQGTEEDDGSDEELGGEEKFEDDVADMRTIDLEEDCYGFGIACLVRDCQRLAHDEDYKGHKHKRVRRFRLFAGMVLVFINIFLQVFLMWQIKKFVTARSVHDIREAYDSFELALYLPGHTTTTIHNKTRGVGGEGGAGWNAAGFNMLTEEEKENACRIPFSEPPFFYSILFIWSLTAAAEIKKAWLLFTRLILYTDNAPDMGNATDEGDDGEEVIRRLTIPVKVIICVIILIPRVIIAVVLLWLGCRWLTATNDFADLLLNAVALEFILLLKELLYHTLVPGRNKHDLSMTKISVEHEAGPPNCCDFLGAFAWFFITLAWVIVYAWYLQTVLPGYNFDVHTPCTSWKAERYKVRL